MVGGGPNPKNLNFFPWEPQTLNLNPKTETLNLNLFPCKPETLNLNPKTETLNLIFFLVEAQTLKTLKILPGARAWLVDGIGDGRGEGGGLPMARN